MCVGEIDQLIRDLPSSESATQTRLRAIQSKVQRILDQIRSISHGLHPSIIEDLGLSIALKVLCQEFSEAHGIAVRFEAPVNHRELSRELSIEKASCLYRIAQECLQNAEKHAGATVICVTFAKIGENLEVRVTDDGVGLPLTNDNKTVGLGIVSMKERASAAHGTLSITSKPHQGTEIRASVPLMSTSGAADVASGI